MSEVHNPIDVIHEELLGQLRDIVRVCNAHDIPYNLMCGTAGRGATQGLYSVG